MATKNVQEKPAKSSSPQFVIALTTEEAQELSLMLGEIPAKFANPVFNFFNQITEKRKGEQQPQSEIPA